MGSIAVIYRSRYGAAKKYAEWIAEALNADLLEKSAVEPDKLSSCDGVVYGGGLYAGRIAGIDLVTKNPCRKLAVFTVGLASPGTLDHAGIVNRNLPPGLRETVPVFHMRGAIDYGSLSFAHRLVMVGLKKFVWDRKPESERTEDDRILSNGYGGVVDFTDRQSAAPVIEYARSNFTGYIEGER